MKDQKDIEKEHLEAIEETIIIDRRLLLLLKRKHSRITKKHRDIARLEGMIKAYEEWHISELLRPSKKQINELREQLEELKQD